MRHLVFWLLGVALVACGREPPGRRVDLAPYKDHLVVFEDGGGRVLAIAVTPPAEGLVEVGGVPNKGEAIFVGDRTRLHQLSIQSWQSGPEGRAWKFRGAPVSPAAVEMHPDGSFAVRCGNDVRKLARAPDAEAKGILDHAEVVDDFPPFVPYVLAVDGAGTQVYVDRVPIDHELSAPGLDLKTQFRVFRGTPGHMKQLELTDVDSYYPRRLVTSDGELTVPLSHYNVEGAWKEGERSTKLTEVQGADFGRIVYEELGVYARPPVTPCSSVKP